MMKAYSEYNKCSKGWLEYVPSHWKVLKGKYVFSNETQRTLGSDSAVQLAASQKYGVIPQKLMMERNNAKVMLALKGTGNFKIVKRNDFVISLRSFEGGIEFSEYDGCISPAYTVLRMKSSEQNHKYFRFLMKSTGYIDALNSTSEGIRDGKTITYDQFGELFLPFPPENEQKNIAQFLHRETSRIDHLIVEKQNFINLLNEKCKAMIAHVVTKGLATNVPMKDSNVEWIGDMPKHWELTKLRYLGFCQNGINIGGEYFGSGYPFVSYGDVYKNKQLPLKVKGLVQSSDTDRVAYSVEAGDVLFTRTSETIDEIGFSSTCFQTIENAVFAGFLIRFRPFKNSINTAFSKYYFQNEKLRAFFVKEMNLVTRASLSQELLKRMPVTLPPIEEQVEIANYLDKKTFVINEIITETKKSIELLKEHRIALISAAVTGKIDVREKV